MKNFEYLQCCKDTHIVVAGKQNLNSNEAITLAGCGSLYLHELMAESNVQQLMSNTKGIIESSSHLRLIFTYVRLILKVL